MKHILLWGCALSMVLAAGCVTPEQYQSLENRIIALEMENNRQMALQAKIDSIEADLSSRVADLEKKRKADEKITRENMAEINYELKQVQEKFGELKGQIEVIEFEFGSKGQVRKQDLEKRLDRLDNAISRNHTRLINLETYMGFEPTVPGQEENDPSAPGISDPDTDQRKPESEKELYEYAKKMFDEGDLENARIQFENFINKYPDSKYAGNARFWVADSYYVEKWYEKAILEYQKVIEQYPDSNKTVAARLKQGYAFAELGEKANARLILNELITRHPDSREAAYAREKLKHLD
ncbi:MAG: tol-pal system protein YbgF [Desulfotignum sp.]|nr:tol-pal system protein YbgF [Desulfotignum sp.]